MEGSNPELQAKLAELEHELEVSSSSSQARGSGNTFEDVACAAKTRTRLEFTRIFEC